MKNYLFHLGIDISKSKLDVAIISKEDPNKREFLKVKNTSKGVKSIVDWLKKKKIELESVLFCCENTGVYTNPLTIYLAKEGLDCWVVPAIEIKKSKGISRGKSDKTDALDIAWYSIRNIDKLRLYETPGKELQQLKVLNAERDKVMKAIAALERSQENKEFMDKEIYSVLRPINAKAVKNLKDALKLIDRKIKEIINSSKELKQQVKLVRSVKGIGEQTSIYLVISTREFKDFDNWRKLACYSGIAPFEYSSGSSVRGKTRVNHFADKKLKTLLHMCALSAIKHDSQIKEYYIKKKAEGKHSLLVLNNVKCKLVSRVFAVINRQTPYVELNKFAA